MQLKSRRSRAPDDLNNEIWSTLEVGPPFSPSLLALLLPSSLEVVCFCLQVRGSSGGESIIRPHAENKKASLEEVEEDSNQGTTYQIPHSPHDTPNNRAHSAATRPKTADFVTLNSRTRPSTVCDPSTACDARARGSERTRNNIGGSNCASDENRPPDLARTRSASIKSSLLSTKSVPQAKPCEEARHISEGYQSAKAQTDTGSYGLDLDKREESRARRGAAAGAHSSENQHPQVTCLPMFFLHSQIQKHEDKNYYHTQTHTRMYMYIQL
jgi:hypothetical protein